jgi:hypothetical protein
MVVTYGKDHTPADPELFPDISTILWGEMVHQERDQHSKIAWITVQKDERRPRQDVRMPSQFVRRY